MSNLTMREIERDFLALEDILNEQDGHLTAILEDWLCEISRNLSSKSDGYFYAIEKAKALEAMNKKAADEYTARARKWASVHEYMRTRIKETMLNLDVKEIQGSGVSFKLSRAAPVLELNEALVPDEFIHTEVIEKKVVDKEGIKAKLKEGISVSGARLLENYALRMRMEVK